MRDRYRQLRTQAYEVLGNKCVECGEDDYRVLTIDHVNNDGNIHRNNNTSRVSKIYKEIIDGACEYQVQLLCANCHAIKTYNRDV